MTDYKLSRRKLLGTTAATSAVLAAPGNPALQTGKRGRSRQYLDV